MGRYRRGRRRRRSIKQSRNNALLFVLFAVTLLLVWAGNHAEQFQDEGGDNDVILQSEQEGQKETEQQEQGNREQSEVTVQELTVHFIDVGQGDSILIQCKDHAMLIDAGDNNKGTAVQLYLRKQGVEKLDYLIGTHPDADHIGGMDVVITKFDCEKVMMPEVTRENATYRDVVSAMKYKNYKNTAPVVGTEYELGDARFTIVAPNGNYGDSYNDYSIGILLSHGENRFLFIGDAQEKAEEDMLSNGISLQADVLKIAHHGSKTSSGGAFLDAVSPVYAVISCGEGNDYGHPHSETLNNLRQRDIKVFRTDEQGSITVTSDGKKLIWNCAPSESWQSGR